MIYGPDGRGGDLGPIRLRLSRLDADLRRRIERGDIAYLSLHWLLKEAPERILRRQDLERTYGGRAHLSARKASALLGAGKRHLFSLTYGWRSAGSAGGLGWWGNLIEQGVTKA